MPKAPIDIMFDRVEWVECSQQQQECDLPYATHHGVLELGVASLRVYQLSNGQRVIDSEDFLRLFEQPATADAKDRT